MKIELTKPGQEAVLTIAAVEIREGAKGNMVIFTTATGDELAISESAVERQLDFCNVENTSDLAGKVLHFSRKANNNPAYSPYWNISTATTEQIKLAHADKPNGQPIIASKRQEGVTQGTLPGDDQEYADAVAETFVPAPEEIERRARLAEGTPDPWTVLVKRHQQCVAEALKDTQRMKELGLSPDEIRAVFAGAATLLIARNQKGI